MNFKLLRQDDGDGNTKANYEIITKRIITELYNEDDNLLIQMQIILMKIINWKMMKKVY